jgi:predicted RNase H-like HicB family nuclease
MTHHIIFETEANGTVSAYVVGHPVYAQAATRQEAERLIQQTLTAYLQAHPEAK